MKGGDSERHRLFQEEVVNLKGVGTLKSFEELDSPEGESADASKDKTNNVATPLPPHSKAIPNDNSIRRLPGLGWWNVYFLSKLTIYWYSVIGLHPLENLAFALALIVPIKARWFKRLRTIVAIPVAAALAYYDSWLPPFERLVSQASLVATFSWQYMFEIAGRFVSWPTLLLLVIVLAAYTILAKRLRVGVIVIITLVALTVVDNLPQQPDAQMASASQHDTNAMSKPDMTNKQDTNSSLDALFESHFQNEANRFVRFKPQSAAAVPFDIVFLHICSLSWDDLAALGLSQHPLFARFDITLTRFNSVATYSGPAVIRLLRAPCGQPSHTSLYGQAPENCYLLPELQQAGFETNLVLNHDGHFDDMLGIIHKQGAQGIEPMSIAGLPINQRSFDGSPIYSDLAVLNRWADTVESGTATRVAAIYNSISLHDGNKLINSSKWSSSKDTYKVRLENLLNDIDNFITRMEQSNRRMVIALIPEHGAAFRGDKMQISGMREIPTPTITLVPVGVKVIGPGTSRKGSPVQFDEPTTYLALSHIISRMLEHSPFEQPQFSPQDYVIDLPKTRYVAENGDMVMMQSGDQYYLHMPETDWREYVVAPLEKAQRP